MATHPLDQLKFILTVPNVGGGVEQQDLTFIFGRNVKLFNYFVKQSGNS